MRNFALLALTALPLTAHAQLSAGIRGLHTPAAACLTLEDASGAAVGSITFSPYGSPQYIDAHAIYGVETWSADIDPWLEPHFTLTPDTQCASFADTWSYEQAGFPLQAAPLVTSTQHPFAVFEVAISDGLDNDIVAWVEVGADDELAWFAAPRLQGDLIELGPGEWLEFTRVSGLPSAPSQARQLTQSPR